MSPSVTGLAPARQDTQVANRGYKAWRTMEEIVSPMQERTGKVYDVDEMVGGYAFERCVTVMRKIRRRFPFTHTRRLLVSCPLLSSPRISSFREGVDDATEGAAVGLTAGGTFERLVEPHPAASTSRIAISPSARRCLHDAFPLSLTPPLRHRPTLSRSARLRQRRYRRQHWKQHCDPQQPSVRVDRDGRDGG